MDNNLQSALRAFRDYGRTEGLSNPTLVKMLTVYLDDKAAVKILNKPPVPPAIKKSAPANNSASI